MFNLDHQSSMAFRTVSEPSEPPRCKRPLSVIEETLDEDLSPEEASRQQRSRRSVHNNNNNNSNNGDCSSQIPLCNGTGNGSHLRTNGVKKTRKKVVFGDRSPVLLCFPDTDGYEVDSTASADEHKVPSTSLAAVSEYKVKNCNKEFSKNHEKDSNAERGHHPTRDSGTEGDLSRLKDTATKLNLKTRRQSYLTWRAEYVDKPRDSTGEVKVECCHEEDRLTRERKDRIDKDLQWIKGQLIDLRRQDQSLARQLLGIRHELSNLRLAASCEEHRDLLDDAEDHVQELRELSRFVDFPPEMLSSSPGLRHIGVTKMNLSSRRFSAC